MQRMPQELVYESIRYLPFREIYDLGYRQTPELQQKIQKISESFPPLLMELFNIRWLLDAPELAWEDKFLGGTGYIDRIRPCSLTAPIMMGKDEFDRAFICIRVEWVPDPSQVFVITVFQRFSDSKLAWTTGCHHYKNFLKGGGYLISNGKVSRECHWDRLDTVLKGLDPEYRLI